ncbi:hypothetical protein [Halobacillus litoralis]|nr:hypothetical protein [Halobacillus litoralis]
MHLWLPKENPNEYSFGFSSGKILLSQLRFCYESYTDLPKGYIQLPIHT